VGLGLGFGGLFWGFWEGFLVLEFEFFELGVFGWGLELGLGSLLVLSLKGDTLRTKFLELSLAEEGAVSVSGVLVLEAEDLSRKLVNGSRCFVLWSKFENGFSLPWDLLGDTVDSPLP
jgi:hypothetical protein